MLNEKYTTFAKLESLFTPEYYSLWLVQRNNAEIPFVPSLRAANPPKNLHGIFRTYSGVGKMITKTDTFFLKKNSLIILKIDDILFYNDNSEETWEYMCLNYTSDIPFPLFEINKVYDLPFIQDERNILNNLLQLQFTPNQVNHSLLYFSVNEFILKLLHSYQHLQQSPLPYYAEIQECLNYINTHLDEPLKISELSKRYRLSISSFYRAFINVVNVSPKTYITQQRFSKAAFLLTDTTENIQTISEKLGYYSPFQFSRDFKKYYGVAPTKYRASIAPNSISPKKH